jgi:hypothetical protein
VRPWLSLGLLVVMMCVQVGSALYGLSAAWGIWEVELPLYLWAIILAGLAALSVGLCFGLCGLGITVQLGCKLYKERS